MSQHYFLTSPSTKVPLLPTDRWKQAFSDGKGRGIQTVQAESQPGDVVWLSTEFPNWLDVVGALVRAQPARHVVVISLNPYDSEGLRAINAGARGYCHQLAAPVLLEEVARAVLGGALWIGPELVERIVAATRDLLLRSPSAPVPPADLSALSAREAQVAQAVAAGKSNKEVAKALFISERTVKAHLGSVFEKLGVRDRLQLALRLSRSGAPSGNPA